MSIEQPSHASPRDPGCICMACRTGAVLRHLSVRSVACRALVHFSRVCPGLSEKPDFVHETLDRVEHYKGLTEVELNVRLRVRTHRRSGPKRDPNGGAREGAPCNWGATALRRHDPRPWRGEARGTPIQRLSYPSTTDKPLRALTQ